MNLESINTVTAVAAAAGYAGGMIMEQMAVHKAAENREALAAAWTDANNVDPSHTEMNHWMRLGRTVVAPLALGGAVVLGLNTYAWMPASTAIEQHPATLEIVVDKSGATNLSIEGHPVASEINEVVNEFRKTPLTTDVILARAGTLKSVPIDQVASESSFGDANMAEGTSQALSRANSVVPVSEGKTLKRNAGVIVITNGNNIGTTRTVVEAAATAYGSSLKTPVFVVNVEGAKAGEVVTDQLEAVAKDTGASYWSANSSNLQDVANSVRQTITAREQVTKAKESRWPLRALGGVAAGLMLAIYAGRSNMPFMRGPKGE